MNLERVIEAFFVRIKGLFGYIHAAMLVLFAVLIIVPPLLPAPAESSRVLNNFTLFASFLLWGLWFPLVLLSVIVFGRLWCGLLCPQGALSEFIGKRGLNWSLPRWMRKEWMPVASFVFVTVLGQLVGVRDYPLAALEILGGTMVVAALVGFLYAGGRRPWCRYLCPLGPLLGIFSRLGGVSIEKNGGGGKGCACPTFINTQTKTASSNCIECFRCINPENPGSLHLRIRRPGVEVEHIQEKEPEFWEVVFLFAATGLALGAFHWQVNPFFLRYKEYMGVLLMKMGLTSIIGRSGPWWIMVNYPAAGEVFNWLDLISITSFMLAAMAISVAVLSLLTVASASMLKERDGLVSTTIRLGYLYAPVALVSLILGLGQILFSSLGSFGLGASSVRIIEATFFGLGGLWSVFLALRLQGGLRAAIVPNLIGIGFVSFFWYQVLF